MEPGDRFLMGVDLRKDIARIEAAYNDSQGVTAAFNRNMLLVLNHELGADFDPPAFDIGPSTIPGGAPDRDAPRLLSRPGRRVPGLDPVAFTAGESIRTEISTKYDRAERGRAVRRRRAPDRGLAHRSGDAVRAGRGSARMTSLTRAALAADLEAHTFAAPASASLTPRRVGAEAELIPVETATWRRCPIEGEGPPPRCRSSAATAAGRVGPKRGRPRGRPASRCRAAARSLSSRAASWSTARRRAGRRARCWRCSARSCCRSAAAAGDGHHAARRGHRSDGRPDAARRSCSATKRYERMADYLGRRGPAGARMMRQTASFQVALDLDDEPWLRWRVLNAAAPYVVAIFANSPVYAGVETGCASTRAQVWRALDPARTGLPWGARAGRRLPRLRARGPGDPVPGGGRRAPALRRVARSEPT